MKRFLAVALLAGSLVFSLAACGSYGSSGGAGTSSSARTGY